MPDPTAHGQPTNSERLMGKQAIRAALEEFPSQTTVTLPKAAVWLLVQENDRLGVALTEIAEHEQDCTHGCAERRAGEALDGE